MEFRTSCASDMLASICIPSYNRPELIKTLLDSVDCRPDRVEVVIHEDKAPRREEVRAVVEAFAARSPLRVIYRENEINHGYDANIRSLVEAAQGDFVIFMGDDDWFLPRKLESYLNFLEGSRDVGYVLRSYCGGHPDGTLEPFQYLGAGRRFEAGIDSAAWMFKRSVCITGVTFRRASITPLATDAFDGTLLYQVYLAAEVTYKEPSVYCPLAAFVA